jgi:hypothetical protein
MDFVYTPFDLIKETKFSSHSRVNMYFYELKSLQMEATTQYLGKRFFVNRS